MILVYKSCIFCDTIYDASVSHVCSICTEKNENKIDVDPLPEESVQNITMSENNRLNKRTIISKKSSRIFKEEPESTDDDSYEIEKPRGVVKDHDVGFLLYSGDVPEGATQNIHSPRSKPGYMSLKKKRTRLYTHTSPKYTDIPSQIKLYELVMQLSEKCETLQNEVSSLKTKFSTRLKRDIADYLQYDQRPTHTFLEWVTSFTVTDEILQLVFDTDLTEGVKKCIENRILEGGGIYSIPIRVFKEKPDYIFIYTNEPITVATTEEDAHTKQAPNEGVGVLSKVKCVPVTIQLGVNPKELLKNPIWRMVSKNSFTRVKEYIAEHILKKFYMWEKENEPNMIHSTEKMDMLTNYTLKVIGHGSKCKRERQNAELYKWFFSKMAIV